MKKLLLFIVVCIPINLLQTKAEVVNLALLPSVEVSTSFVSDWEDLSAVNDGFEPTSSTDRSHPIYGNWNWDSDGKSHWVQYEWPYAHEIHSVAVYWFTDNGGLAQPVEAYLEIWNGLEWERGPAVGLTLNRYNTVEMNSIRTKKIRLNMRSKTLTGIIEFKVIGVETTDCDPTAITPRIKIDTEETEENNIAQLTVGASVGFLPETDEQNAEGKWFWFGPNSFTSNQQHITLTDIQINQGGTYKVIYINPCGTESTQFYHLTVSDSFDGEAKAWPEYNPTIHYSFREEYPDFEMPTKDLNDGCSGEAWRISDRWWTFIAGKNANPLVTESAVRPLLDRLNEDFAYIRDVMGWPPDARVMNGYRSAVYLYGSGLCTDDASNTDLGGWQSATSTPDGRSWPNILISYYPTYCFDPACTWGDKSDQQGGVVHEGIHAIFASLPGCRDASWFHEGANTWLQGVMEIEKGGGNYNNHSLGWLSMGSLLAPFIPIECYSGWLQDGSFGGPAAQGVTVNVDGTYVAQTRNLVGGVQYSSVFATFLGEIIGQGSVPWVWQNCTGLVLEGISKQLGHEQTQRLIREYRARIALSDMGRFQNSFLTMYRDNMGKRSTAEFKPYYVVVDPWYATPYAQTTKGDDGYLIPEYRTTPGWSGANIIPIHTEGDVVTVNFKPLSQNMSCQLCYRTKAGEAVYGEAVFGGDCTLKIDPDKKPANGVVFAVICNMDYIYEGEVTRTTHHDYRLKLGTGALRTANVNKNWFDWRFTISDPPPTGIAKKTTTLGLSIYPNPVGEGELINVKFEDDLSDVDNLRISNLKGQVVYEKQNISNHETINANTLTKGIYMISIGTKQNNITKKLIVK